MRPYLCAMVVSCVLFFAGCAALFGEFDTETGAYTPGLVAKATGLAKGAGTLGVPYATAGAGLLGIIGTIGTWFQQKRQRKQDAKHFVRVIEEVKDQVVDLTNRQDVKDLVRRVAPPDTTKFGRFLAEAHAEFKNR